MPPVDEEELNRLIAEYLSVPSSDSEITESEDSEEEGGQRARKDSQRDEDYEDDFEDEGDEGDEESESGSEEWEDKFPYEENIFRLSQHYHFIERLGTAHDAVVYSGVHRHDNCPVAIKIKTGDRATLHQPKLVNLLSRVQGHPNLPRLVAWHSFPDTTCYVLTTEQVPDDDIEEFLFGNLPDIKIYVADLVKALLYLHDVGIIYRDVKPSNLMWSTERKSAVLIDYDVSTFYREDTGHNCVVGSDGYMAPEIIAISDAKDAWKNTMKLERARIKTKEREERRKRLARQRAKQKKRNNRRPQSPRSRNPSHVTSDDEEPSEVVDKPWRRKPTLDELNCKPYGLAVDCYSAGVVLAQLVFEDPEDDILEYPDHNADMVCDYFMARIKNAQKHGTFELSHHLIEQMLQVDPAQRIPLSEVLSHPFYTDDKVAGAAIIADMKGAQQVVQVNAGCALLLCSGCNEDLPKTSFSKNQLKKKGEKAKTRKCTTCTADCQ